MTFRMKNIEWGAVSKYRGEMMGIAIIMIVLFHTQLPQTDAFFGLKRMGNIGVDVFLFLSGLGLWFSLTGQPSLKRFFKRLYRPAGRYHSELGFLASRRTYFLVYPRNNDALPLCTHVYTTY